ncbi:hypothetical protein MLD38_035668 [Melastoma candidum]|uniref:Uncharacterized protein n=1 Tax=Melastoma candidum TaxID=119954 RepID=A0ACB9LJ52_9MYRT|nr:hypothetical protein MLD38_035668 [Melastoma candidum]
MKRQEFHAAIRAFCLCVVYVNAVCGIGVNWGTIASHPIAPPIVVGMLKDNGINKVKLFDADPWTVTALAGSGIEVVVAVPNDMLHRMASDYGNAKEWVKENVTTHLHDGGVKIKYVAVGNEPFLASYNGSFLGDTFPALKNIQRALDEAGLGETVKATVPHNADVYESPSNQPSDGAFRSDIQKLMTDMVNFLDQHQSPFMVNIYPFLSLYANDHFPFEFSFCDQQGQPLTDGAVQYTNVFDANYDTLVWSLKKAGVPNLKIIVGEVGWPTDGNKNANIDLAKRFYDGFMAKMAKNEGTPLRPGSLDVYLFSLLDEDMKSIAPGMFERHWGIFRYDGKPKFPMDFTGEGQDKLPIGAKGVQYLPKQWCLLKKSVKNLTTVWPHVDYACSISDCSSMELKSSCGDLDSYGRVSYVFNMHFQMQDQDVEVCDFNGMAELVSENASTATCLFPVQIVSSANSIPFHCLPAALVLGILISHLMGRLIPELIHLV